MPLLFSFVVFSLPEDQKRLSTCNVIINAFNVSLPYTVWIPIMTRWDLVWT